MTENAKFERNCPECDKVLGYSNNDCLQRAIKKNSVCKSCSIKTRSTMPLGPYIKKCPQCDRDIIFKSIYNLKRSIENNATCRECKKRPIILERSCPSCNETILYQSNMARRRADKNNIKCQKCRSKPIKLRTEKYCYFCRETKPISDFGWDASRTDGHRNLCKTCVAKKQKERRNNCNIQNKLAHSLRRRLSDIIRRNKNSNYKPHSKPGSAVSDLGCSLDELKNYLELMFYNNPKTNEKMTWNNWCLKGWHIDHIKPLSSFNLMDREQLLKACHYTNLQPLWAFENLSKGSKILPAHANRP